MFFTDTISIPSVVKQWRSVVTDREPPSTWMEAKKAYRRGALIHHPDKCRGNSDKFKILNEAYESLQESNDLGTINTTLKMWKVCWDQ